MLNIMANTIINVASQFSRFPAGRYVEDGPFTGAKFRNDLLLPALKQQDDVTIELDGVVGYGSSFLEEAFGGLVRLGMFTKEQLHEKLKLESKYRTITQEIWGYIDSAA
jgi:hypothetical protein